jgi:cytochrome c oxidase subunit 2
MPAFGVKMDAIPGRVNETWFKANKEGLYYGQCSELCGINHAFMPVAVRAVSRDQFEAWQQAAADDLDGANRNLMAAVEEQRNIKLAQSQNNQ